MTDPINVWKIVGTSPERRVLDGFTARHVLCQNRDLHNLALGEDEGCGEASDTSSS